jgi:uncharacterized membrane protein YjfL (UPF0719 family)
MTTSELLAFLTLFAIALFSLWAFANLHKRITDLENKKEL